MVVEAEFRTQTVVHNSMETHQAVCVWEGDDHLTVYISTQFVWGIRENVAEHFGLPQDNVRVVCEFMGGGFGSKNSADASTYVAAELARDRQARQVHADPARGEPRRREPERHHPAAPRRRAFRRDADCSTASS